MPLEILQPDGSTEKRPHPIPRLQAIFRGAFEEKTGQRCKMTFAELGGRIKKKFEQPDVETGELLIEYPDEADWEMEVKGYMADPHYQQFGYAPNMFIATYGNHSGKVPAVKVKKMKVIVESQWETCDTCLTDYVRGGKCPKCN